MNLISVFDIILLHCMPENRITRTGVGVAFRRAVYVNSTFHGSGQVQLMLYLVELDIVITFAVEYM